MSKLCGIWHFDWRPASREDEERVSTALDYPGYSTPRMEWGPGMLLGWAAGSEAPAGGGIGHSPDRSICLWDGRLDNPDDLLRQTGLPAGTPEAAICLHLYRDRGVEGLRDVVGDWSLCIWDAGRREIVFASDFAGIRPLYYSRWADGVCWSSSLDDVVRWTGISRLDDAYVAGMLTRGGHGTRTPYAGILAVGAGQAVTIGREKISEVAFWHVPFDRKIQYSDEREYEEHLLELFREAVRSRIAGRAACAELSGGLDSSSIVCMADRLRRQSPDVPAVTTFSYLHENSSDEKFIAEVERSSGLPSCHFALPDCPLAKPDVAGAIPTWWEPRFRVLARRMSTMGSRALLTGQLGDLIMGNTPEDSSQVTEWLAQGSFRSAAREAYAWARATQVPIYPILWRSIREAYFSWVPPIDPRGFAGAFPTSMEDSLSDGFRTRVQEDATAGIWREVPPGRRQRFRAAGEMLQIRRLQTPEPLQHLSYTHPYAHRPLVEFMLTIPPRIIFGPNQPRRLMRRAFDGLLPPMILKRMSKTEYTAAFRDALVPMAAALLRQPGEIQLVERGYLEPASLLRRLERFTQGLDCNESQLRSLLLIEFWLKNRMAHDGHRELTASVH